MSARKPKTLRPSTAPVEPTTPAPLGGSEVVRPTSAGGEANLVGSSLAEIGAAYVDLGRELHRLEELVDDVKRRMKAREEWMIEEMISSGVSLFRVKGADGVVKTIYTSADWIVSKAKGVTTDDLANVLRAIGFQELVADAVNANTLKATAKEAINRYRDASKPWLDKDSPIDPNAVAGYCSRCSRFFPPSEVATPCPACSREMTGGDLPPLIEETVEGIPRRLRDILYIEERTKINMRTA